MPMKVKFDSANIPEKPTFVLAYKNGKKIGAIEAENIITRDCMNNPAEISFKTKKYLDDALNIYWDQIKDFRLIWYKEADIWFEMYVDMNETTETVKTITSKQLGQAELGQIKLFSVEINTENDIAREDYVLPTVLYRSDNPKASLLHRILEKAPHYKIRHVDDTIRSIQRTFTFDNISIPDALNQIATEIGCLVVYHSGTDKYGMIEREISLYDLQSNCMNLDCHHRGEFTSVCPECGCTDINEGYGEDTTIFVTADELADNINLTCNRDQVKNCFKLQAGDDLMTATIKNCNPNGSEYIWYLTDEFKEEMSQELRKKLVEYDELYRKYTNEFEVQSELFDDYRNLIEKYIEYPNVEVLDLPLIGYHSLMKAIYHTIDMELFLRSGLMPIVEVSDTNAQLQAMYLTSDNLSPVSVADISKISLASANNAVLSMARVIIDSRYKVEVEDSNFQREINGGLCVWSGRFVVTNYSDENDTYITGIFPVEINDDYESFVQQKLNKLLSDEEPKDYSLSGIFKLDYDSFCNELRKYSLNILSSLHDMAQTCVNFLIEQGITSNESWGDHLYEDLYIPRNNQLIAIESEMLTREQEIETIIGRYNNEELVQAGFQTELLDIRSSIQNELDFSKYLDEKLWIEFCSFRREDIYQNQNFVSDGLNNAEIFKNAMDFIDLANNEIFKSAEKQHSITATLKNLLFVPRFQKLVKMFNTGNWIRIQIDNKIYKLRLLSYEINYDNTNAINVEFSDVLKTADGSSDQQAIFSKMMSMTTSYNYTQKQASQGANSNMHINQWMANGLDAATTKIVNSAKNQTQEWGSYGMVFREYDPVLELYNEDQMKIINSTIAITNDNWKSSKVAIGKFYYTNQFTNQLEKAYGVNAEALVGKVILGESLGIYSNNGRLSFNDEGFIVSNDINTVRIDPNSESIISVTNKIDEDILSLDDYGNLMIVGKIRVKSIEFDDGVRIKTDVIDTLHSIAISGNYNELENLPELSEVAISGEYEDLSGIPIVHGDIKQNNTTEPVSGKAVYDYAISIGKTGYSNNIIFGTNSNGEVRSYTIAELKALLGITT